MPTEVAVIKCHRANQENSSTHFYSFFVFMLLQIKKKIKELSEA